MSFEARLGDDSRPSNESTCKDACLVLSPAVLASLLSQGGNDEAEGLLYGTASTVLTRVLADDTYGDSADNDGDASEGGQVTSETTYGGQNLRSL